MAKCSLFDTLGIAYFPPGPVCAMRRLQKRRFARRAHKRLQEDIQALHGNTNQHIKIISQPFAADYKLCSIRLLSQGFFWSISISFSSSKPHRIERF